MTYCPPSKPAASAAPKQKSPAQRERDLRRAREYHGRKLLEDAEANAKAQDLLRAERASEHVRSEALNQFAHEAKNRQQRSLDAEKLRLRREVRVKGDLPSEGHTFDGRRV